MVFQSYALYPHMTVRENLAYGLRVRRTGAAAIRTRIAALESLVAVAFRKDAVHFFDGVSGARINS